MRVTLKEDCTHLIIKVVDQNYFTTTESRNYCLALPDWYPCINCTAKMTSSSIVMIIDNEPDEVTQCKNTETVHSAQLNSRLLSLNRRRKACPLLKIVQRTQQQQRQESRSPKNVQLAMCRKSDLTLILVKMIWKPLRRESVQLTLPKARNGL